MISIEIYRSLSQIKLVFITKLTPYNIQHVSYKMSYLCTGTELGFEVNGGKYNFLKRENIIFHDLFSKILNICLLFNILKKKFGGGPQPPSSTHGSAPVCTQNSSTICDILMKDLHKMWRQAIECARPSRIHSFRSIY